MPRLSTTQGKDASRPTATVTFGIGSIKRGPSVRAETNKNYFRRYSGKLKESPLTGDET